MTALVGFLVGGCAQQRNGVLRKVQVQRARVPLAVQGARTFMHLDKPDTNACATPMPLIILRGQALTLGCREMRWAFWGQV